MGLMIMLFGCGIAAGACIGFWIGKYAADDTDEILEEFVKKENEE